MVFSRFIDQIKHLSIFIFLAFKVLRFVPPLLDTLAVTENLAAPRQRLAKQCHTEHWAKPAYCCWDGPNRQWHHWGAGRAEGTAGSHQKPSELSGEDLLCEGMTWCWPWAGFKLMAYQLGRGLHRVHNKVYAFVIQKKTSLSYDVVMQQGINHP